MLAVESLNDADDAYTQPLQESITAIKFEDDYSSSEENGNSFASRSWARAEFLMWAIKKGPSPALVQQEGIGGAMTTVFGDSLDHNLRLGGRFTIGTWFDSCQKHGIEANYFFLNGDSDDFKGFSSGLPGGTLLSRPFIDSLTGNIVNQDIYIDGAASGTIDVSSKSQSHGAELNLLSNLLGGPSASTACDSCDSYDSCDAFCSPQAGHSLGLISGFRYLNLDEDLSINESLSVFPGAPLFLDPGSTIALSDTFSTRNHFYGAQLGLRGEWWRNRWFVTVTSKIALGTTHQQARIAGTTVFTSPTAPVSPLVQQGGLLALTNIGRYSRNRFTTVPEISMNLGRQVNDNVRATVGYNFIYWSNVLRPGNQFNGVVDQAQLPVPGGPAPVQEPFAARSSDFWAQGISFGLEYAM